MLGRVNVLFLLQVEREARRVRQSRGGHQRRQGDREAWHEERHAQSQGRHRRQRRTKVVWRASLLEPGRTRSRARAALISSMASTVSAASAGTHLPA